MKSIKVKLYLNDDQIVYSNKLFGCSRFVYNNCLNYKINEYKNNNKSISFKELGKYLTDLKGEFEWIKESHSKVLQQSLINLNNAYNNFFKTKSGFPKFKKKFSKQSCRFPVDAISGVKGNRINIIKPLSNIHFKCSKKDEKLLNKYQNLIKSATLTKNKSGDYHLSVLIDIKPSKSLPKTDKVVGLDLGIKDFIVTSEGQNYENLKIKRSNERKLRKLNQNLSRKQKGSKNKNKSRIKLAKYHEKLNNIKENYLHLIVNQIINENQVIVMEDLNVSGMLKNKNLAKSIQELSLNRFKTIMSYKSEWYERDLVFVDRFFPSSKTCSCCGYINKDLTLKDRKWKCNQCNSVLDRDLNAAINIKNEGIKIKLNKIGLSSPDLKPLECIAIASTVN
ncbi:MAG: RNA-guided endonuclease TnpB family protein [Saccharofermentanales bacterium]